MSETAAFVRTSGQKLASLDPPRVVHREQLDGRASHCRCTLDKRSEQLEMIGPTVASRVEQRDNLARDRIDAGQVRAFAQIAAVTGEGQILVIVAPTVLARNYVFDVMG
jgi:hypothetical protein